MSKKNELKEIAKQGFKLIEKELGYKQVEILRKLKNLGFGVSPSSLSNCIGGKEIGKDALMNISNGMAKIIETELGYVYNAEKEEFIKIEKDTWTPAIIPTQEHLKKEQAAYVFYANGRLSIQEKVRFMQQAQTDITEVGVRLRTFAEYFISRNESEFRQPIEQLLQKGIHIKLYVLDPDSNESRLYFEDRGRVQKDENESSEITKKAIAQLKGVIEDFKEKKYKGSLQIYTYKHIPYNHFLIVDGAADFGKMMISHYIYGIRRADCPVLEFSKTSHPALYKRYWQSFQALALQAKQLI